MKQNREVVWWLIVCLLALLGFFVFLLWVHPAYAAYRTNFAWMFDAGPAFFATIACTAFFLMLRFFIKGFKDPSATRFRHIFAALLVSLAGVLSWEIARFTLNEEVYFRAGSLPGVFLGSFAIVFLWLLMRIRDKENKNNHHLPHL